jgi:phosphate transport system permease protein
MQRTPRRRLLYDRLARIVVTTGGLAIVASVLGILLFIVVEVAPLLYRPKVESVRSLDLGAPAALAWVVDPHRERGVALRADGTLSVVDLTRGAPLEARSLLGAPLESAAVSGHGALAAATGDGRVAIEAVRFGEFFDGSTRRIEVETPEPIVLELDPEHRPLGAWTAAATADGGAIGAAVLADGRLAIVRRTVERNALTEETRPTDLRAEVPLAIGVERLLIDEAGQNLYGADHDALVRFRLEGATPSAPEILEVRPAVTALALLVGQRSLVTGHTDGSLAVWSVLPAGDGEHLTRLRSFHAQRSPIVALAASPRTRSFAATAADGTLTLYHSTSERVLWSGRPRAEGAALPFYAPKSDALFLLAGSRLDELALDIPHPEISTRSLLGRVAYEGYAEPRYVWQSTGGSDDFEPKLSLIPLAVGTLKGTIYALVLAIPLGVLGAMYTSQFLDHRARALVKPTVEIMAALPSVVLGFLAGLWLAPRIERGMPALVLLLVLIPGLAIAAGAAWRRLPARMRQRLPAGSELVIQIGAAGLALVLALLLGPGFERWAFGGPFPDWLLRTTGLAYDQRNAVVVGVAMGFAVIPILFSIAEDAFSNVPRALVSGSLALGATRWQTAVRVVLPSASPGIFSAIMIGFGRAVGETMIVLMATGNTPLMSWSPFNGFRALSANVAVELPEAPEGGTLFRVLFLAAFLLFCLTFAVNTIAEVVRLKLRARYRYL